MIVDQEALELLRRALVALEVGPHEACSCSECRPLAAERRELRHEIALALGAQALGEVDP